MPNPIITFESNPNIGIFSSNSSNFTFTHGGQTIFTVNYNQSNWNINFENNIINPELNNNLQLEIKKYQNNHTLKQEYINRIKNE